MQQRNKRTMRDMTVLGGWLFADLLLALMVIFMAAQPAFPKPLPPTPVPTFSPSPTPTLTPTPTQEPRLDFNPVTFNLNGVDFNGILNNTSSAVGAMEQLINSNAKSNHVQNRSAGLVVVYDGAQPNSADLQTATNVGNAVIANVLKVMGKQRLLFQRASYYGPIFQLYAPHSNVTLDIFFFKQ